MKAALLFSFVAVVTSHVLPTEHVNRCEEAGPEVYCASQQMIIDCEAEAFCAEYSRKSPCEKGPAVFCKSKETAIACDKEALCLTWPDDHVVAVKIRTPPPSDLNPPSHGTHVYYNGVG